VKLFAFDDADATLVLVPLAARRALDEARLKLSLEGWKSLGFEDRRALVEAGSLDAVDVPRVRDLARRASTPPKELGEPPAVSREAVEGALDESRPLSPELWRSLLGVERYVLCKVAHDEERARRAYDEIVGARAHSTHLDPKGNVHMVDVGPKSPSERRAVAETYVELGDEALGRLTSGTAAKGEVLATVRLAGIMAAKRTPEIVPLCHSIALTQVSVEVEVEESARRVRIIASVSTFDRTGVEMEALVAASAAALTLYDMLKAYDRGMQIGPTRLLEKSGGRSGDFLR
jgi:molybdenum cofactor biosynthesis protein MoaC